MTQTEAILINTEDALNSIKRDVKILLDCQEYKGDFKEANDRQFDAKIEELQYQIKRINLLLKDLPLSIF